MRNTNLWFLLMGLVWGNTASFGIETAGELFVDLDAATLSPGDTIWENAGTYSDFMAVGSPMPFEFEFHLDRGLVRTQPAVFFNRDSAYIGMADTPDSLVGNEPRSIEVWAYGESYASAIEQPLVGWGRIGGPVGTNMVFGQGANPFEGAVFHHGESSLGWRNSDCFPPINCSPAGSQWHHFVYTYDGEAVRIYSDGELWNDKDVTPFGGLNTHSGTAIALAGHWQQDGVTLWPTNNAKSHLSRIRIHDGVLSAEQIASNYNEEKRDFPTINPGFRDFSHQIDPLQRAIKSSTFHPSRDFNQDLVVDAADQAILRSSWGIWLGDANSDREFNSSDLVSVFRAGKFEDNDPEKPETIMNSTWSEGDWNADGDFDTSDFVVAFQEGGYEKGPRPRQSQVVPEPHGFPTLVFPIAALIARRKRTGRNPYK